jgi:hypothetical protein
VRKPGTKVLEDVLEINDDPSFVNFIEVSKLMNNYCSVVLNGIPRKE